MYVEVGEAAVVDIEGAASCCLDEAIDGWVGGGGNCPFGGGRACDDTPALGETAIRDPLVLAERPEPEDKVVFAALLDERAPYTAKLTGMAPGEGPFPTAE